MSGGGHSGPKPLMPSLVFEAFQQLWRTEKTSRAGAQQEQKDQTRKGLCKETIRDNNKKVRKTRGEIGIDSVSWIGKDL